MYYPRTISNLIQQRMNAEKAIIIIGPRQVGKTTLVNDLLENRPFLQLSGDESIDVQHMSDPNTESLKQLIGSNKTLFIDEAQRIPNIGLTIKVIIDRLPHIQLIVTGSSALEMNRQVDEPLTGRKWEFKLFPISWEEYESVHSFLVAEKNLENRILYGLYPEVLNHTGDEIQRLQELKNSYLYRDILALSGIQKSSELDKLLRALALQIGSEVSLNELAGLIGIDRKTVDKYIHLLEQSYIVFRLSSFSRNVRNEIKKSQKIYFYDTGIRNAILNQFHPLSHRPDKGGLWENFLIAERVKQIEYKRTYANRYFWRTKQKQEVDYIEQNGNTLKAYEFKWDAQGKSKISKTFTHHYDAITATIDRHNFRDFVVIK